MEYVPIFLEWLEVTQDLTAEEKGRLIDAVVTYAAGGNYDKLLQGPEKIAFRFLKGQVDRNKAISEKRSKSGSSKSEHAQANESKTEQTETNENKADQTATNSLKEKEKEKEKNKEKNKEKEKEKEEQQKRDARFEEFWNAYPRHEAKQIARKAFDKLDPDDSLLQTILKAVAAWRQSDQWTKDGGQFVPHPATWLNQRRWEDDIPKPSSGSAPIKHVQEQQYEQRDNTENDGSAVPDWITKYHDELIS